MKAIIPATTEAVNKTIQVPDDGYISFGQTGLTGTEQIKLQINMGGWVDSLPGITMDKDNNYIQVAGPNTYRIVKPVTASPVTVYINE